MKGKIMKIGIANRDPKAYQGGDNIQIDYLCKALSFKGVDCHQPLAFKPNWSEFDVVHAYHLNFSWSNIIYENIWEQKKPYFITAIFYPTAELGSTSDQMMKYVNRSLFTVVHSTWEKEELLAVTGCNENKIRIIPNGVGSEFVGCPPNLDCDHGDREYVITVTARDGDKNSKIVKNICEELSIPYLNICNYSHDQMPEIYKSSKVFVNASESERMSLTTHEALAAYCKVISTEFNRGNEWFPCLITCNPTNYNDLKYKIKYAYQSSQWCYIPNEYAANLRWDVVAERYLQCLKESQLEF